MASAGPPPVPGAGAWCGLWVDDAGGVHRTVVTADGGRAAQTAAFRPFAWLGDAALPPEAPPAGVTLEELAGPGPFRRLAHADGIATLEGLLAAARDRGLVDLLRPWESQVLLQGRERLYRDLPFTRLRRCQLDLEVASPGGGFPDAARPSDRILAIGLRQGGVPRLLLLEADTDEAERALLRAFQAALGELDPDVIEGHNVFRFDLDYLRQRARRLREPCLWGRYGARAVFRSSRLKLAERWVDFPRCDLPGRAVVDTFLLVQLHDVSARELTSYGLKEAAVHFGITAEADERTRIPGAEIQHVFRADPARFRAYLEDDLRETAGLADRLLPTYYEQARTFPLLLQDATLRGATAKIDLLFLEEYYHARQACPLPPEIAPFAGGLTVTGPAGVFREVLHFDVASLYPSLLLLVGRNPRNDALGVFLPLLARLREYRLQCKQRARTAVDPAERAEAQARQASFKILINSFYGYLGFSGARFGDGQLAAEVTRRGRELLQALIAAFTREGAVVLEADTDGLYVSAGGFAGRPEDLLARVAPVLPPGIELEHDGRYAAMFCYKAKNYALRDGGRVILRGSALRSRGLEPFLRRLTDQLVRHLLGLEPESPLGLLADYRRRLAAGTVPVAELARSEVLSQSPEAYARFVAEGGKPRRAAAEAALQLEPRPRLGDRIAYYLTPRRKGMTGDWQRARPVELHDPVAAPCDPGHYLGKLEEWRERHAPFLAGGEEPPPAQGELF